MMTNKKVAFITGANRGIGSVGLSAVMAARVVGATTIVAVDTNDARLALARAIGATHTFNPTSTQVAPAILELTGSGLHYALDTTSIAAVIRQAVMSLAPRGACGNLGVSSPGSEIMLDEVDFMGGGRCLLGIVEGEANPDQFILALIELHHQGRFPFNRMVRFYPFERISDAIHDSETGVAIKPVLRLP